MQAASCQLMIGSHNSPDVVPVDDSSVVVGMMSLLLIMNSMFLLFISVLTINPFFQKWSVPLVYLRVNYKPLFFEKAREGVFRDKP